MTASQDRIKYLLGRYADKQSSQQEETELFALLVNDNNESATKAAMIEMINSDQPGALNEEMMQRILKNIFDDHSTQKVKRIFPYRWVAAAAILIGLLVGSYFIFFNKKEEPSLVKTNPVPVEIAPGKDGAILTLANGRKIVLDNAQNGKITEVAVKNGNQLSYQESAKAKVEQNTMTTPNGRQYSLVLSDGTKVWLNAASSISFPTAFVEKERRVEVTGEVYFEVAKNASKPFKVKINGESEVEVLGTHFNINAYKDEGIVKTTLLEGRIKITNGTNQLIINPGEQTQTGEGGEIRLFKNVDTEGAVAWKNGYFKFYRADIPTVMRQLARWYDLQIVYPAEIPAREFGGEMERSLPLSSVLRLLEKADIHFRLQDKKLIVLPKGTKG